MKQDLFVVQLNETTELYLKVYTPQPEYNQWGSAEDALTWHTLEAAQNVANLIGGGTVGTTKP